MAVLALGVSHRRAPVELLERLALADDEYPKAYARSKDLEAVDEAVVLSTCNRVEVYAEVSSYHAGFQALKRLLCEPRSLDPDVLADPLYSHYGDDAALHLFHVAAGLDSMILGEPQILSQVRAAARRAEAEGASGPVLRKLFGDAVRVGRRIRVETGIGASPSALVDEGLAIAERAVGGLRGRNTAILGAGQMASIAVQALLDRAAGPSLILNRNVERARPLAEASGGRAAGLGELPGALADADLVISSTGSAGMVVPAGMVEKAMASRARARPLFVMDIAVPRDVEPAAGAVGGVTLLDIDGIRDRLEMRPSGERNEIAKAEAIVAGEMRRIALRREAARLAPLIRALRERGDRVREVELERYRSRLASLTPEERETVEALARGIVAKLLHDPIVRVKELSRPGDGGAYERALSELFGLEPK